MPNEDITENAAARLELASQEVELAKTKMEEAIEQYALRRQAWSRAVIIFEAELKRNGCTCHPGCISHQAGCPHWVLPY